MSLPRISALLALVAISAALASPTLAAKNDARFQKSAEAHKAFCADIKLALDTEEAAADKRGGTKDAKPYAEEADRLWAQGQRAGCSWTN